jgi:hypothetical protein
MVLKIVQRTGDSEFLDSKKVFFVNEASFILKSNVINTIREMVIRKSLCSA